MPPATTPQRSQSRTARRCSAFRSTSASAARCRQGSDTRWSTDTRSPSVSTAMDSTTHRDPEGPRADRGRRGRSGHRLSVRRPWRHLPTTVRTPHRHPHFRPSRLPLLGGQRADRHDVGLRRAQRGGIRLFAAQFPHDYPRGRSDARRLAQRLARGPVQVDMRERTTGSSSITFVRSLYYIVKVTLALLVASLRRYARLEGARR